MAWELWLIWILIFLPILFRDIMCLIEEYRLIGAFYFVAVWFAFTKYFIYLAERS